MIKQSVLKQVKKGEWVKAKFCIRERRDIIIIVIIVLSYLSDVIFSNLIYLTYLIKLKVPMKRIFFLRKLWEIVLI